MPGRNTQQPLTLKQVLVAGAVADAAMTGIVSFTNQSGGEISDNNLGGWDISGGVDFGNGPLTLNGDPITSWPTGASSVGPAGTVQLADGNGAFESALLNAATFGGGANFVPITILPNGSQTDHLLDIGEGGDLLYVDAGGNLGLGYTGSYYSASLDCYNFTTSNNGFIGLDLIINRDTYVGGSNDCVLSKTYASGFSALTVSNPNTASGYGAAHTGTLTVTGPTSDDTESIANFVNESDVSALLIRGDLLVETANNVLDDGSGGAYFLGVVSFNDQVDFNDNIIVSGPITASGGIIMNGSNIDYPPANPSNWASTAPTTIEDALDRMAAWMNQSGLSGLLLNQP
jgi:hypothetical protein